MNSTSSNVDLERKEGLKARGDNFGMHRVGIGGMFLVSGEQEGMKRAIS